jgi:hypothetical protein
MKTEEKAAVLMHVACELAEIREVDTPEYLGHVRAAYVALAGLLAESSTSWEARPRTPVERRILLGNFMIMAGLDVRSLLEGAIDLAVEEADCRLVEAKELHELAQDQEVSGSSRPGLARTQAAALAIGVAALDARVKVGEELLRRTK